MVTTTLLKRSAVWHRNTAEVCIQTDYYISQMIMFLNLCVGQPFCPSITRTSKQVEKQCTLLVFLVRW